MAREVPVADADRRGGPGGRGAAGARAQRAGLASSQGDARRQLEQGGVSVNGEKAAPERRLGRADALHDRWVLLRKGKKGWALVDLAPGKLTLRRDTDRLSLRPTGASACRQHADAGRATPAPPHHSRLRLPVERCPRGADDAP